MMAVALISIMVQHRIGDVLWILNYITAIDVASTSITEEGTGVGPENMHDRWLMGWLPIVGILHQNFRSSLTLSLLHIIIKEASRYNLVFVP